MSGVRARGHRDRRQLRADHRAGSNATRSSDLWWQADPSDNNNIIPPNDPQKFKKAVHLDSIHVDFGMQCADCHFSQDNHGNGHIYTEVQGAIEITCSDCHGTATSYPDLKTHGPAAPPGGTDLSLLRTADGRALFEWRNGKLYERAEV